MKLYWPSNWQMKEKKKKNEKEIHSVLELKM